MMISPFLLFFYLTVCHLIFDIKEAALSFRERAALQSVEPLL